MDDKRKYTPDSATVMRESKKETLDAKLSRALDNPDLDRAIARVKPKLRPGEDPLFYDVNRPSSPSLTGVTPVDPPTGRGDEAHSGTDAARGEEDDTTVPGSPWAKGGDAERELDKDALPSAHLPPAAPPTSVPIPSAPGRGLPPWLLGSLTPRLLASAAVFAVLAPVIVLMIVSRTTAPGSDKRGAASTSATAPAPPAPTVATPTARPTSTSVAPTATTGSPAVVDAGGAVPVQPAPSLAPTHGPRAPTRAPQPAPTEDPYSSPPRPPATVAPAPPPTVTPVTPPAAPSAKTPTDLY